MAESARGIQKRRRCPETKKASHPGGISLSGTGIDSSLDDSAKVVGRRHLSPSVAFGTHHDHCSKNDWFMNSQLKERLIYEQSAARTVREQPEKRSSADRANRWKLNSWLISNSPDQFRCAHPETSACRDRALILVLAWASTLILRSGRHLTE